jgi:hypothetical protein
MKIMKSVAEKCNATCQSHHAIQQLYPRHEHATWHVAEMKQAAVNPYPIIIQKQLFPYMPLK